MSIEVRDLTRMYGSQVAVNKISFTVGKGEIVGFLGPNGAGKSTTMKIITGYLHADSGEVKVCGINASTDPLGIKQKTGYLPEANPLYYDMYVREYLGFIASAQGVVNRQFAISNVIELTGLAPESRKKIGQLSKGYKQRVGLAAALVHDPEVLILDEPTSGLDPNQIIEIRNVIRSLASTKTILFSTHIMQEVEALCDRLVIINKGNLVADDRIENLRGQNNNSRFVVVEFSEPFSVEKLVLHNADNISTIKPGIFRIGSKDPESIKKQLLQFSIQHNLNIISLQSEKSDLESIFKTLTTGPDGNS